MSEKKLTSFKDLNVKIADTIQSEANNEAVNTLVQKRLQAEVTRRADVLEKALDKYNTSVAELKKIKPDVITHGIVGDESTPVKTEQYSDKLFRQLDNLRKTIAAFDIAFLKVFGGKVEDIADGYKKLHELTNQGGSQKKGTEESGE